MLELFWLVPILLDFGNIIFFIANIPQVLKSYKNRKNLKVLSSKMLLGYISGSFLFAIAFLIAGGMIAFMLCLFNFCFFSLQLYWKWKYRNS